jgi:hypothetical protein
MQCDKKSLFVSADASYKRNLMVVGGHADHPVDLCGEDSDDGKRQCRPSVVDDPLFWKALVTTARMGQSAVCMGKGTVLGKRQSLGHNVTDFVFKPFVSIITSLGYVGNKPC